MASIGTNISAMIALQTLNATNKSLADVQKQISTGKRVASAADDAAIFAISKVMESDVAGFKALGETLALGGSTAKVAADAASQLNTLLNDIKGKIIKANEENLDSSKLQNEIESLRGQVAGIVSAAQFNGLSLLSNTDTTAGSGTVSVLSSLDRTAAGGVTTSTIDIVKRDLGAGDSTAGTAGTNAGSGAAVNVGATGAAGTIASTTIVAGQSFEFDMAGGLDAGADLDFTGVTVSYVARDGETRADVVNQLVSRLNVEVARADVGDLISFSAGANGVINLTNNSAANITVAAADVTEDLNGAAADGTIGGGLELLGDIDVTTEAGARAGLAAIEGLIQTATDAQAAFGTSQRRIELQADFMTRLSDSFNAGIGALVDADLEAASARLQALQVQQQLGVQALSIANQAPQVLLGLFR